MLRSIKNLTGYPIEGIDDSIGKVQDCLFDDNEWTLRYVVADTGSWLPGKQVLLSSIHFEKPEYGSENNRFRVALGVRRIEEAPSLDTNAPVSRQFEEEFARYYGQRVYWEGAAAMGASTGPVYDPPKLDDADNRAQNFEDVRHKKKIEVIHESRLRSASEVIGYAIRCSDDEFGQVEDLILDDETWRIRFLVVGTRSWLPGRKFLIDVNWVDSFDWADQKATVGLARKQIESSPKYEPHRLVNKDYLDNLYDYYGRSSEQKGLLAKLF